MQRPGGRTNVFAFTIEDARRAGLLKKTNWIKYPISMLIARASAIGIKSIFPDAIFGDFGMAYELDELEDSEPNVGLSDRDIAIEKLRTDIMALANRLPEEKRFTCLDQTNKAASKYNIELLNKILARTKEIVESGQSNSSNPGNTTGRTDTDNMGTKEDEGIGSVSSSSSNVTESDNSNSAIANNTAGSVQ